MAHDPRIDRRDRIVQRLTQARRGVSTHEREAQRPQGQRRVREKARKPMEWREGWMERADEGANEDEPSQHWLEQRSGAVHAQQKYQACHADRAHRAR